MTDTPDVSTTTNRPDFTVQQWELVGSAPVLVFVAMALADRKVSVPERDAFYKQWMPRLVALQINDNMDDEKLLDWGMSEAEVHLDDFLSLSIETVLERLEETFTLLDASLEPAKLEAYRSELMNLAQAVAAASGDLFGLRSPVRESEQMMLRKIQHALRGRPVV